MTEEAIEKTLASLENPLQKVFYMTLFFGASLPLSWQLHIWTFFGFVPFLWPMQEFCESPKKKEFCNYKSLQWSLKIAISSLQSFFYFNNWEILLNIRDIFSNKNPPLISFNNYCIFLFSCTEIVAWVSTKTRCRMMNVILFIFCVCRILLPNAYRRIQRKDHRPGNFCFMKSSLKSILWSC